MHFVVLEFEKKNGGLTKIEKACLDWQQGRLSDFKRCLWSAISRADDDNLELLSRGFPAEVKAYKQWTQGSLRWQLVAKGYDV